MSFYKMIFTAVKLVML